MKNYFEKTMNKEQGRKSPSPLSVVNTRDIDSTFTPIGRADCAPDIFKNPTILAIALANQGRYMF
jgi:hypothetical protein